MTALQKRAPFNPPSVGVQLEVRSKDGLTDFLNCESLADAAQMAESAMLTGYVPMAIFVNGARRFDEAALRRLTTIAATY